MTPVRNATTPVTVSLVENLRDQRHEQVDALRLLEDRDQHRDAADHHDHLPRHPLDRLADRRPHPVSTRTTAPRNAPMPTFTSKNSTLRISVAMTASVSQCRHSNGRVGLDRRRSGAAPTAVGRTGAEQLQAAEQEVAAEGDQRVRAEVVEVGRQLVAGQPVARPSGR